MKGFAGPAVTATLTLFEVTVTLTGAWCKVRELEAQLEAQTEKWLEAEREKWAEREHWTGVDTGKNAELDKLRAGLQEARPL